MSGILLQIMEEGVLTDSTGRRVSFKNAIVVMTSNIGGDLKGDGLGFVPTGKDGKTQAALHQVFTPEFLGRLDRIVCFQPLEQSAMERIAKKYLQQLQSRMAAVGIQLTLDDSIAPFLGKQCKIKEGARYLRRLVQERVEGPLAEHLLRSSRKCTKIHGTLEGENVTFHS